jgi:ADP-ribosylglycohydrolase
MTYREKSKLVQGWDDIAPKRFYLGLYTDDTALSLCIADSLILNKLQYDPLDIRHRFVLWWICGYNNGFSKSPSKISMGIGSSTAKSFLHFLSQPTSYVLEEPNFAQ